MCYKSIKGTDPPMNIETIGHVPDTVRTPKALLAYYERALLLAVEYGYHAVKVDLSKAPFPREVSESIVNEAILKIQSTYKLSVEII